ncbi:MAG: argininosuccinate synthase, partial [Acidimicrobiia bacterium]|nr:argininosuccinate synthase [Acidimicrobiia bacterium]
MTKVVLAYSGGLDTSVILAWLREVYDAEVITFTADVGQGEEVEEARQKALDTGAVEAVVADLRREFVTEAVFPAFRAGALYEGYYLLGTSLARPIITRGMIEVARRFGADAISHGATGKGNDQVRFELSAYALEPDIEVIAPWREWDLKGRADLVEYARRRGISVPVSPEKPYSTDANLLHVSYEGGILEDPWASPPDDMFTLTTDPRLAPEGPEKIVVSIEKGNPVAVNGQRMEPVALLEELNHLGGSHGVGRVDMVENRFVGIKSRGVYETPGGTILFHALRAVESITLDRQVAHLRDELAPRYAEMVYNGFWFAPERYALQTLFD